MKSVSGAVSRVCAIYTKVNLILNVSFIIIRACRATLLAKYPTLLPIAVKRREVRWVWLNGRAAAIWPHTPDAVNKSQFNPNDPQSWGHLSSLPD